MGVAQEGSPIPGLLRSPLGQVERLLQQRCGCAVGNTQVLPKSAGPGDGGDGTRGPVCARGAAVMCGLEVGCGQEVEGRRPVHTAGV